jgi:hypothetical protein
MIIPSLDEIKDLVGNKGGMPTSLNIKMSKATIKSVLIFNFSKFSYRINLAIHRIFIHALSTPLNTAPRCLMWRKCSVIWWILQ